ncbi:MAG: DUF1330 domain-containing protein [Betaproteobacteria bacterium]|nr:DUF1330 domain-containing protein [Betaproteobacteria bacterium]MBM3383842.1 DUF1330 domain-containing protein [Betaproteobacteria bacterium]
MPKAYWISCYRAIHKPEALAAYAALAGPAVLGAGGRFIVRGMPDKVHDNGIMQRTVVVEFDSLAAAHAAHDGPAYGAALKALGEGVERDFRIVEAAT